MSDIIKKQSQIDQSLNIIYPASQIGQYEARFVRREDDYFIIYVSSQSGCDQACRMCHLTATGQNKLENASYEELVKQAALVYEHYDIQSNKAKLVHYNFMARGEALNNPVVLNDNERLLGTYGAMAQSRGLEAKYLISTIMPESMGERTLVDIFPNTLPEIYYSLYSTDEKFRKKWLARALPYERSLELLKEWQDYNGKVPKIHFAFIEGENDSEQDMINMAEAINEIDLKVNLNIVRYNPYSDKYGKESDESVIHRNVSILVDLLKPAQYRVVPKVGFDVQASCGMFVGKNK